MGWREETSLFGEEVGGEGWMEGTSSGQSVSGHAGKSGSGREFVCGQSAVCVFSGRSRRRRCCHHVNKTQAQDEAVTLVSGDNWEGRGDEAKP